MSESAVRTKGLIPRRKGDLPWRRLADDRAWLLDLDSGSYYELGGSAPYVWCCLDGQTDIDGVGRRLSSAFGIDEERAREEVAAFVEELGALGLLADPAQPSGEPDSLEDSPEPASGTAYSQPTVSSKGNLKYLGQFD